MEKFDIDDIYAALSVKARAQEDMLDIEDIAAISEYEDASDEDVSQLLTLLSNDGTDFFTSFRPIDKDSIKRLSKEIRECSEEESKADVSSVKMYLQDISKLPVLDCDQEKEIIYRMLEGSENAAEELIEGSMYLPVMFALKYMGRGILFLDLVQEGNMALMSAASEITEPGRSFAAFCAFRLQRLMSKMTGSENSPALKLPRAIAEDLAGLMEEEKKLPKELDEKEKIRQLSAALKISEDKTSELLEKEKELLEGYSPESEEEYKTAEQSLPQNDAETRLSKQVGNMLTALPEDEARVISLRFGIGGSNALTPEQTAEKLGISLQQVTELEQQALRHLGG